jgi:hypothetical protein
VTHSRHRAAPSGPSSGSDSGGRRSRLRWRGRTSSQSTIWSSVITAQVGLRAIVRSGATRAA